MKIIPLSCIAVNISMIAEWCFSVEHAYFTHMSFGIFLNIIGPYVGVLC
jgi:hypothetical protein